MTKSYLIRIYPNDSDNTTYEDFQFQSVFQIVDKTADWIDEIEKKDIKPLEKSKSIRSLLNQLVQATKYFTKEEVCLEQQNQK